MINPGRLQEKYLTGKFNIDLIWNFLSLGLIGVIGVLINVLIIRNYGSTVLGVFNQVYAIYILLSQLAVGGVHLSIQSFIPRFIGSPKHLRSIFNAALFISAVLSIVVVLMTYCLHWLPGLILSSQGVGVSFVYVIFGLFFFSLNKVMISYCNGLRRMKAFAVFQSLRFIFMIGILIFFIKLKVNSQYVPSILSLAECFLFCIVLVYNYNFIRFRNNYKFSHWLRIHFRFGNKALMGNFLLDVNTRVDVFILGIFLTDKLVGVYSFAANIAEGLMQFPVLFRNNINPLISQSRSRFSVRYFEQFIQKKIKSFYKIISGLSVLSIICFPLVLIVFGIKEDFLAIWVVFSILAAGIAIAGGYLPFQMIFNQIGKPMQQTVFIFLIFLSNVAGNVLLVPLLGIYGSAAGTALSFILLVVFMKVLLKRQFNIHV